MNRRLLRIFLFVVALLIVLAWSSSWLMDLLWMQSVGYSSVFWKLTTARWSLGAIAFGLAAIYLVLNLRFLGERLQWVSLVGTPLQQLELDLTAHQKAIKGILTVAGLVLAFFFALSFASRWDASLRFLWTVPFGTEDPLFGRDISFFLFQLPFWELIQAGLAALVFLTLLLVGGIYVLTGLVRYDPRSGIVARRDVINQLRMNAVVLLVLLGFGFFLSRYRLLLNRDGVVFGAGYTEVHVVLPALWLLFILSLVLAGLLLAGRWVRMKRVLPVTAVVFALVWILGRGVVPSLVRSFQVDPNELELEREYLEHNIEMTRLAYGLDRIREVDYDAADTLTLADIRRNQDAVNEIRLWDPRLLIQTYKQLQEIRSYYEFYSVDNDRYIVNGQPRQMMLSAREISPDLPGQSVSWLNRRLQYTHGYGLVMSPVAETDQQGQPRLRIRDLPPVSELAGLTVDQPAIYYGEAGQGYYIVNTATEELDYPAGDENAYTRYDGEGGIQVGGFFRKLLFSWVLGDVNILLSDYIQPESKLQIWRGVQDRIRKITPFLQLDNDPYLVLNDGRLFWIQDAYTTSEGFPYSQPIAGFNYIRNSVKVVVDAYHGTVNYYVIDENDPVLKVYDAIFPNVFKPISELPAGLEHHFRYPQDLFEIQLELYNRYHMTLPQVFYNNEDLWTRPNEKYAGQIRVMEPFYVLARLPGETELRFMLISPMTPQNRDNMIAWLAAKSDADDYGELVVYKLPKQRLIYGPAQIDARIDQDPEISRQLALWDQRGSRVIRGNLMVIPIENSFLYVEPVFLLAEGVDIPQLQRVIVAVGDDIAMEPTIEMAMVSLFADEPGVSAEELGMILPEGVAAPDTVIRQIGAQELERVRTLWNQLQEALSNRNWSRYGELMDEMDRVLQRR